MAQDIRVRGEDTTVRFTIDGDEVGVLDRIESFTGTLKMDITESEFLGMVGVSVDNIVKGFAGQLTLQIRDEGVFDFVTTLAEAAARRIAIPTVNIQTQIVFPSGAVRAMLARNCVFGDIPLAIPNRTANATISLTVRSGSVPDFPTL